RSIWLNRASSMPTPTAGPAIRAGMGIPGAWVGVGPVHGQDVGQAGAGEDPASGAIPDRYSTAAITATSATATAATPASMAASIVIPARSADSMAARASAEVSPAASTGVEA